MFSLFKKNKYKMDINTASNTLKNVFEACNMPANTTSFRMIVLQSLVATKLITICKWIATIFLIFVLLMPLFFKNEKTFIVKSENSKQPIEITEHILYENEFVMILFGNSIDYDNIYSRKNDGSVIFPSKIDRNTNTVIFPYDGDELNIFIPDTTGKTLQAVLSEKTH